MLSTDEFNTKFESCLDENLAELIKVLEEVLQFSGDIDDQKYIDLKNKAEQILNKTKLQVSQQSDSFSIKIKQLVDCASEYFHKKPWHGVGIGITAGLFIGLFVVAKR